MTATAAMLGALSTAFAPAPTCGGHNNFWQDVSFQGQVYLQHGPPATLSPQCYPPAFIPVSASYYSPGFCPSGYTAACSQVSTRQQQTETMQVCCPTDHAFSCAKSQSDAESVFSARPFLTTMLCWSTIASSTQFTVTELPSKSNSFSIGKPTYGPPDIVAAYAINVRFKQFDKDAASSDTQDSNAWDGSNERHSIPAAVWVGIGLAVGIALAFLVVGGFLVFRRSRRRRMAQIGHEQFILGSRTHLLEETQHEFMRMEAKCLALERPQPAFRPGTRDS